MKTAGAGNEFFHDIIENNRCHVDRTPFAELYSVKGRPGVCI